MLDELKAVYDVALVCREKEASSVNRLPVGGFGRGDFRSELDAATDDAPVAGWERTGYGFGLSGQFFEVGPGIGLAGMRCEGASVLGLQVFGETIAEVVVTGLVRSNGWLVLRRREVDGCSCVHNQHDLQGSR